MAFLGPQNLKRFIAATDARHRTLIMTACYTGMRQSEVLGLEWGDIDWRSGKIYVRRVRQQGRFFEPALRAAGLRKVTFHALRHSYVSLLLSQGESIKFISRQVGHSSAKLTLDVYAHLMEGAQEEAMRRLEERLAITEISAR